MSDDLCRSPSGAVDEAAQQRVLVRPERSAPAGDSDAASGFAEGEWEHDRPVTVRLQLPCPAIGTCRLLSSL